MLRVTTTSLVGRAAELEAIRAELELARGGRLRMLALEGKAGIGKSRLLEAARYLALDAGMTTAVVTSDEELRVPFLTARSLLRALGLEEMEAVLSGRGAGERADLTAEERRVRLFDVAAGAIDALAGERPPRACGWPA